MDLLDDKTPTAEECPVPKAIAQHAKQTSSHSSGSSSSSRRNEFNRVRRSETSSSSSSSSSTSFSSLSSSEREGSEAHRIKSREARTPGQDSDMSNSYHEIFDTQMPASLARASLREEDELLLISQTNPSSSSSGSKLPGSQTQAGTTDYLTNKLVEDSLLWQKHNQGEPISPEKSPRHQLHQSELNRDSLNSIDPNLILDLENDARHLATSVDSLIEGLAGILHSISALTVETTETYRDGICKTCDEVDNNIKSMYQLMAKVEELNKSMTPAYKLGEKLKDIKRLLEVYESAVNASSK